MNNKIYVHAIVKDSKDRIYKTIWKSLLLETYSI